MTPPLPFSLFVSGRRRRGNIVFLTQVIGIGQAAYTVPAELSVALEARLKQPA